VRTQLRILATAFARVLQIHSPKKIGRRGDRVRACTRGLACKSRVENAHEHTGSAEAVRPSLRNGFTAYIVLSPARPGLLVTVARKKRELPANLTPATGASGPHVFIGGFAGHAGTKKSL
jgi:hypothetical protein